MKRSISRVFLISAMSCLALSTCLADAGAPVAPATTTIQWNPSYDAAVALAKDRHRLVLVDFYTDWCGWCKVLDAQVYPDPAVEKAVGQYEAVKVNAEKEGVDLAKKYQVSGYPTIVFLDTDGNLLSQIGGYEPAPKFAADVNQVLQDQSDLPLLTVKVQTDPSDLDSTLKLAEIDTRRQQTDNALALAAVLEKAGKSAELVGIYNGIGDTLSSQGKLAPAVIEYKKAVVNAPTADTDDLVDAHVGLVTCYMEEKDLADTKAQLRAIVDLPNAPADLKQRAKSVLTAISKNGLPSAGN